MSNIYTLALRKAAERARADNHTQDEWFHYLRCSTPETVLALLDELEAKDKSISFLKNQLAQLANFNPDWDKLEAATDSLREHMAELTAARKRIAELSHHLQNAHEFIEHTEAFGHEASNGILCCGDAQWNIDASKSALSASGFNGEV
ncbi:MULTISPECIES: ead/Ea22-like family protein [Enterobacter cloacae complex]|uniref:ead/Ea22-like family protein n=1 Tax=Enterobacter cloacae complex TaxID=354276 RepID=UPI0010250A42|nr:MULTISPECIES: ead/Ea22-like family protein [Enterobacter cloacae complex]MBW7764109.1 ead/Ea22-like family protein [Enterobacter hormaechei]MCW4734448.1 ead/Ea22-like family protein [Enterobacter hormaechei subsp. xiangfangensis]MDQ6582952.1 ead/Ea22-like family protein [Enterobacter hormaechei]MDQ6593730.1 ead/Ea22-like family protein [Enterobacter hormaechei]RYA41363.1 hypothetical protein DD605_14470 [Enterobacter cloacae complex sp. 3DZ3S2B]